MQVSEIETQEKRIRHGRILQREIEQLEKAIQTLDHPARAEGPVVWGVDYMVMKEGNQGADEMFDALEAVTVEPGTEDFVALRGLLARRLRAVRKEFEAL